MPPPDFFHYYFSSAFSFPVLCIRFFCLFLSDNNDKEYLRSKGDWYLEQSLTTQMELMVYLKFWESDYVLKQLYNLCRLIHGESYNWHISLGNNRKNFIEFGIKDKTKKNVPKFFELINSSYVRQIRNASAHSQYRIAGDNLNFFNYDPTENSHLKNILIDDWETIFHKTILLYNHLINNINIYQKYYRELAKEKHFGLRLKIVKLNGDISHEWIRLSNADDITSRWIWYKNFKNIKI